MRLLGKGAEQLPLASCLQVQVTSVAVTLLAALSHLSHSAPEEKGQFSHWCILEINWLYVVESQLTLEISHPGLLLQTFKLCRGKSPHGELCSDWWVSLPKSEVQV